MKVLFISPPAASHIEPKVQHETSLEVALPRIPFEVQAHLNGTMKPIILDLDWEMDKVPRGDYRDIISNSIRKHEPDVVLTSVFGQSVSDTVDQITTATREEKESLPIIVGGQAITHLGERIFDLCPNVDAACSNATALKEILVHPKREDLPRTILNGYNHTQLLPYFPPALLYRGFPIRDFVEFYRSRNIKVFAYLENERGCPFRCMFCAVPRVVQERPVEATIAEAEYLLRRGITAFYLTDLTFGLNRRKTQELLLAFQRIRKSYPRFHFRCITRVDFIDSKMVTLLKSAGCYEIAFGVETSSSDVLTRIGKGTTREQNLEAISVAAKAGLDTRLFLIIGLPGEDISDLFRFLHEVNGITKNVLLQISLYRPIVGDSFEQRIASGDLGRGTMHQLDFRTDCRRYGLDRTQDIVNFILLALAWPSTEISPVGNRRLQDRLLVDGGVRIYSGIAGKNGVARRDDIILIDAGDRKLVYVPHGISVKIRQCLMECDDDFFEFLAIADGTRSFDEIQATLSSRSKGQIYYKTNAWAKRRIQEICRSLLYAKLIQVSRR